MSSISEFTSLGLAPALMRAIAESGYETPTPIQSQAIPVVLSGRDLLAAAQTGTGKTAAFTLPILQMLSQTKPAVVKPGRPRVLILTPTRELAAQVEESVQTYGKHMPLKSMVIFGGVNINPQFRTLRGGIDLLVATPGRLLDHVGQRTVDLSGVEILVLDEADRMLDMGFIRDIRKILALLPKERQNLLFSATFSEEIRQLASGLLRNPATVEVAPRNAASELVHQVAHIVPRDRKRALLSHLIATNRWTQVLVFTKTKHGANRLAEQLNKDGINAMAIHGNKSQGARTRALAEFKDGSLPVLVATDIAARGLDIDQLPHVVNYELPHVAEDYVHRIGRTGRAGSEGDAVSLVDGEELKLLAAIERLIKRPIERIEVTGYTGLQQGSRPVAEFDRDDAPAPAGNRRSRPGPRSGNAGSAAKRPPHGGNRSAQPANGGNRSAQPANAGNRSAQPANGNRSAQPGGSRPASRPAARPAGDFGSRSFGRVR